MRWSVPVIVFVVAAAACAVAHIAIVASVIRRRSGVVDAGVPKPRALVEVLWALVPALALAFLLTATWDRVREHAAARPAEVMKLAR
jgi:heme/copper-type cytochrome/quinol oxidase subunit 2